MASPSASVVQLLENRAIAAEGMIAHLLQQIDEIKRHCSNNKENAQAAELEAENLALAKKIEICRKSLIDLEVKNGKKQVPIPTVGNTSILKVEAKDPPAVPKENAQEAKQKPEKKEKGPSNEPNAADKPKAPKKEKAKKPQAPKQPEKADDDVTRLDLRVGLITKAERHPDADSLYLETIDVGTGTPLTVVSGLAGKVPLEDMQNRLVILLCNLKPAKMRGIVSQAMVMCASEPGGKVEVLIPPAGAAPGDRVSLEGEEAGQPDTQLKSKVWEAVAAKLRTRPDLVAGFDGKKLIVPGKGEITTSSLAGVPIK
ncbi:Hypothetical predicted protein [Cloeon dipterum]|uniref:tRNA-binding domain-containing protein n=1 Tax=Cloeon dipterum TaxID=197152 RepID=A0A8S1C3E0_9INSE|nr:Hypothetical predicted protein [Cloeon dipterum]